MWKVVPIMLPKAINYKGNERWLVQCRIWERVSEGMALIVGRCKEPLFALLFFALFIDFMFFIMHINTNSGGVNDSAGDNTSYKKKKTPWSLPSFYFIRRGLAWNKSCLMSTFGHLF